MHKHRREQRQIDRRRAVVKPQARYSWHLPDNIAPLRDLSGNHAVPQCEFWMNLLIEENHHVDRDQRVVHKRSKPPLCIVVTDRKEKHHTSHAACELRIADLCNPCTFSAIYDSDCRLSANKSALRNPQSAIKGFPTSTSSSKPRSSCDWWAAPS